MKKMFKSIKMYVNHLRFLIPCALGISLICTMALVSCNKQIIDTTYTFDKAVMYIGGEWITVKVDSWKDFEDGDQIQVKDTDGNIYLVHSSNVTLINEK